MYVDKSEYLSLVGKAITGVLGADRVIAVDCVLLDNSDDQSVARIGVTYKASAGLTQVEKDQIYELLWSDETDPSNPFPIIDFQEDASFDPIAAE